MLVLKGLREEPLMVHEPVVVDGTVAAPIEVLEGGRLILRGTATRDIVVRPGGDAELDGTAYGIVTNEGGRVVVRGVVYGRVVTTDNGETDIDENARITEEPVYPTSTLTFSQ
jgi:hypothetical protein